MPNVAYALLHLKFIHIMLNCKWWYRALIIHHFSIVNLLDYHDWSKYVQITFARRTWKSKIKEVFFDFYWL